MVLTTARDYKVLALLFRKGAICHLIWSQVSGLYTNNHKWLKQVEEQPNINHLHVGGLRQVIADIDKHR